MGKASRRKREAREGFERLKREHPEFVEEIERKALEGYLARYDLEGYGKWLERWGA